MQNFPFLKYIALFVFCILQFQGIEVHASDKSVMQFPWDPPESRDKNVAIDEDENYTFTVQDFAVLGWFRQLEKIMITSLPANGALTLDGNEVSAQQEISRKDVPNLLFTPSPDEFGTGYTSFNFKVHNGAFYSEDPNQFSFDVLPINDAPTLDDVANPAPINEDAVMQTVNLSDITSGAPNEEETITVTATSSNTSLIPNPTVSYSSPGTTGNISYTPVANAFGTAVITVTVNDGQAANNATSKEFTVEVNPVNDPPTLDAIENPEGILENSDAQTVQLSGISSGVANENQMLKVTATSSNKDLIADPKVNYKSPDNAGTLTYKPSNNVSGIAEITVTVNDGGDENNTLTRQFTVIVNPLNRPPALNAITDPAPVNEDAAGQTINLAGINSGDPEEDQTLTITASSDNPDLIPDPQVNYTSPGSTGTLSYKPVANMFGSAMVTVTVDDGAPNNNTFTQTFSVRVNPVNDPPEMDDIAAPAPIVPNAGEQTIPLAGINAGPFEEDQTVSITAVSNNPALIPNPTVIYTNPEPTGSLVFTPVAGQTGSAIITITLQDNGPGAAPNQNTSVHTFTVSIIDVPDLVVDNPTISRNTFTVGQNVEVFSRIRNAGKKEAGASVLKYYLSTDQIFQDTDVELSSDAIGMLGAGASIGVGNAFSLPEGTSPGTYFILFIADAGQVVAEGNEANNVSAVQVNVQVNDATIIASINFPGYYTYGTDGQAISLVLARPEMVTAVRFYHRGGRELEFQETEYSLTGNEINIPLSDTLVDEVGVEYYFEIYDGIGLLATTATGFTYIRYAGEGLAFSDLVFGQTTQDYQIIATPLQLQDNTVPAVFEDDLGQYNPSLWRLFQYEMDTVVEYNQGFSSLEVGKGYWLIVRDAADIDTGEGTTLQVQQTNPFTINLQQGWNLIGNPYNFDISWAEVLQVNTNPQGVGNLLIFENGFVESDVLTKMRGGFVFSEQEASLNIPVKKVVNTPPVGRMSAPNAREAATQQEGWQINFTLRNTQIESKLAGFGMNPQAMLEKDDYDAVSLPTFDFLSKTDIKFLHPEHFSGSFRRDIVPVMENHVWEFQVDMDENSANNELSWNAQALNADENQLILYDVQQERIIDMKKNSLYNISIGRSSQFKIYYGNKEFIDEHLKPGSLSLGKSYPNPFTNQITLPFTLANSESQYQVQWIIYNTFGQQVYQQYQEDLSPGFYEFSWNGQNQQGNNLPQGIYIYKFIISGSGQEYTGKIIKK